MHKYPFIDMHCHFFNARYVPIEGVFRSMGVKPRTARIVSGMLNALTGYSSLRARPERVRDESLISDPSDDDFVLFTKCFKRLILGLRETSSQSDAVRSIDTTYEEGLAALEEALHLFNDGPIKGFHLETVLRNPDLDDHDFFASKEVQELEKAVFWIFQEAETEVETHGPLTHGHSHEDHAADRLVGASYFQDDKNRGILRRTFILLRFGDRMSETEHEIFRAIQKDYAKGTSGGDPQPEKYLNVMMDMEWPYKTQFPGIRAPHWNFRKQIDRMVAFTSEDQRIHTFAAVDPFRDEWRSYVSHAVERGIRGFKFYPPMGYRAANVDGHQFRINQADAGTEDHVPRGAFPGPNSQAMQEKIDEFLELANGEDLRVYAHCTPTGQWVKKGFGLNSDPVFWDAAMSNGRQNLWLCLAHGGGTRSTDWHGWAAETGEQWRKTFAFRVVKLCRKYPNVYCGLGYLLEMFEGRAERKRILDRLEREILSDEGPYLFRKKVMYGSDWHMKSMIGNPRKYVNYFYEFFADGDRFAGVDQEVRREFAEDFFKGNALRYLPL